VRAPQKVLVVTSPNTKDGKIFSKNKYWILNFTAIQILVSSFLAIWNAASVRDLMLLHSHMT